MPDHKINLLLDSRKITHGGIGVYIRNIISGMKHFPEINLTSIVYPEHKELAYKLGANDVVLVKTKLYSFSELFRFKKYIDFSNVDLLHIPHFTLPYFIPVPTVITIHDTIHLSNPHRWYLSIVAKFLIKSALKRANQVLTVSESSSKKLSQLCSTLKEPIRVIPNALDPIFLIDKLKNTDIETENKNYFLSIFSNVKKHKALDDLITVFSYIKTWNHEHNINNQKLFDYINNINLVLVGTGTIDLKKQNLPKDVLVIGQVNADKLKALYRGAQALVVPSLEEGFCLPVIEAQSCNIPVITRPVPAILELLTTNDLTAKDFQIDSLAKVIIEFCVKKNEDTFSDDFGVPLSHMQKFDIKNVCSQLVDVYKSVIKNKF